MELDIYIVDAFTDTQFKGNSAAVVPLQEWLEPDLMQNIAAENNLSETAFVKSENGSSEALDANKVMTLFTEQQILLRNQSKQLMLNNTIRVTIGCEEEMAAVENVFNLIEQKLD